MNGCLVFSDIDRVEARVSTVGGAALLVAMTLVVAGAQVATEGGRLLYVAGVRPQEVAAVYAVPVRVWYESLHIGAQALPPTCRHTNTFKPGTEVASKPGFKAGDPVRDQQQFTSFSPQNGQGVFR